MLIAGQCTPHFLFGLAEKKTGRARSKRKERFGGSVCAGADLLPPAGDGWRSLVEVRDGNARPLGKPPARGSIGIPSASLPAAAHAPVKNSQRQRKEKQLDATTTPTTSAPSATGRQLQKPQKAQACPKVRQNRSRHRYADPRAHGGPPHRSAPKRFFLFHRARRILFLSRTKREWGAHPLWEQPPWREPAPRGRCSAARITPGASPQTEGPPLYFSSNTDTYTVPLTSNPSLAFT